MTEREEQEGAVRRLGLRIIGNTRCCSWCERIPGNQIGVPYRDTFHHVAVRTSEQLFLCHTCFLLWKVIETLRKGTATDIERLQIEITAQRLLNIIDFGQRSRSVMDVTINTTKPVASSVPVHGDTWVRAENNRYYQHHIIAINFSSSFLPH